MNKNFLLSLFIISLVSFSFAQQKLGAGVSLENKTAVSDILHNPEEYVGKKVLIEGEVLDVCKMAGCWMEISSGVDDRRIKVKVKDGEIVFPVESIGTNALVEGEVYKIELDKEKAITYYEHLAEENGEEFDPESVTGNVTLYQIKGSGAVLEIPEQQ